MSIIAMTGLPGAGKSFEAVKNQVINALKAGRIVYTNVPVDREGLLKYCGAGDIVFLPPGVTAAQIVELVPAGAYLVLDEVARYWPSGLTAKNIPEVQRNFFSEHRHRVDQDGNACELVLIVQDLSMIAGYIRALVEQTYRMTKLTSIGSKRRYRIDIYEGAVTGQKPPASKRIREMYGKYDPEIWKFYKSHTQSMTGEAGNEDKADKRGNMMAGLRFKLSVGAILVVPFAIWGFVHALHSLGGKKPEPARSVASAPAQAVAAVQGPAKPVGPQWSTTWRLSGRFRQGLADYYLVDGDHGSRKIERRQCKQDSGANMVCTVDGELVADWTGPKPGFVESSLGHTMQGAPVSN